jgi:hypothetical protein
MKKARAAILATASATTEYPSGGTWIYGVYSGGEWGTGSTVRSDYYHGSRTHRSTACNGNGACTYQSWKSATVWSYARYAPATYSGNTAYWDVQ